MYLVLAEKERKNCDICSFVFPWGDFQQRYNLVQHVHESQFGQLAWKSEWHKASVSMEESRRNVFAYSQYTQIQSLPWGFATLREVSDTPNACARNPQTFVLRHNPGSIAGNAAGICLTPVEVRGGRERRFH